jgi:hypothetical protein
MERERKAAPKFTTEGATLSVVNPAWPSVHGPLLREGQGRNRTWPNNGAAVDVFPQQLRLLVARRHLVGPRAQRTHARSSTCDHDAPCSRYVRQRFKLSRNHSLLASAPPDPPDPRHPWH